MKRILGTICACVLAAGMTAEAQQTNAPSTQSILQYLLQDLFIKAGYGFKKVHLGQSFSEVVRAWGQPAETEQFWLLGLSNKWRYRAGSTVIVLVGDERVESIEVIGDMTTPFETVEGGRFGMTPHQLISIYGRPSNPGDLIHLSYYPRGIEFAMQNGGLRALRVFAPRRSQ